MKVLFVLFLFLSGPCGFAQSFSESNAKKIIVDSSTKADILKLFGQPNYKNIQTTLECWQYHGNKGINVCFINDTVRIFQYGGVSDSSTIENRKYFIELVNKVQDDKELRGGFMYKGYRVDILDDTQMRTVVGKFIRIQWNGFEAVYHTKLGYQTRTRFNQYKQNKNYKVGKDKYCFSTLCYELRSDAKQPYILMSIMVDSELKEIN